MLKLDVSKPASRFAQTRQPKHQRQIAARIQALRNDPSPPDSKALKSGQPGEKRVDVGEYRILYKVEGDTLYVILIGKRNDDEVYRRFGRR
jgi:mRNA interferase RelE/StbE